MEREDIKRILKSAIVRGLVAGTVAGAFFIFFGLAFDWIFFLNVSIPIPLFVFVAESFEDILYFMPFRGGVLTIVYAIGIILIWYAQCGFFGGVLYWLLRKKLEKAAATRIVMYAVLFGCAVIYLINKATGYI
jgi:hypothetical protein